MNAKKIIEAEFLNKKGSHAYLFIGDKEKADELIEHIKKISNVLSVDITKVEPESKEGKAGEIKVEEIRHLLKEISLTPKGSLRLAIIYDCEKLNAFSGNILLKSLEEPAGPVIFILVANKSAVLPTIKSRCRTVNLESTLEKESTETPFTPEIKKGFAKASILIERLVKEESVDQLIKELLDNQRKKLLESKKQNYVKNLKEIEEAKKRISQNGNQRLILECLVLKIGEDL